MIRARLLCAAALALLAACGPNDGLAVDLTVLVDSSIDDATLAGVKTLDLAVSGAETYATTYLVQTPIAGRRAKLIYRPGVSSGSLTFAVTLNGDHGPIGYGESAAVSLTGGTTSATVTVTNQPPPGGDGGGSDGGTCASVASCMSGDGCCPMGCTSANDSDCVVCGNGVVEPGEVCDDGNTANGDGCDPTCHYHNVATVVFGGRPSGNGYNDAPNGPAVRFLAPYAPGYPVQHQDGFLYVIDTGVLRQVNTGTGATNAVLGKVDDVRSVDGSGAQARFGDVRGAVSVGALLYTFEQPALVRAIDLGGSKSVTTLAVTGATLTGAIALGTDGTKLLVLDQSGFYSVDPTTKAATLIAAAASFSVVGSIGTCAGGGVAVLPGPNYYLPCGTAVAQVTSAGAVTLYAGKFNTTGNINVNAAPLTNAEFGGLNGIVAYNGSLYVSDFFRYGIRQITSSTVSNFSPSGPDGASPSAYVESNVSANVRFVDPRHLAVDNKNRLVVVDNAQSLRVLPLPNQTGFTLPLAGSPATGGTHCAPAIADDQFVYCVDNALVQITRIPLGGGAQTTVLDGNGSGQAFNDVALIGPTLYFALGDGTIRSAVAGPVDLGGTLVTSLPIVAGTPNQSTPVTDGPGASARLNAVSLSTDGKNLYFFDQHPFGTTLRMVTLSTMTVSTVAGAPMSTDVLDGTGTAAHFAGANGLRFDGTRFVFFDGVIPGTLRGSVVRRFDPATTAVTTVAGVPGQLQALDGVASAARFSSIRSLASDGRAVFVADAADLSTTTPFDGTSPLIREVELATGRVTTMIGQGGHYAVVAGTGINALVNQPQTVVLDAAGKRILVWDSSELVWTAIQ